MTDLSEAADSVEKDYGHFPDRLAWDLKFDDLTHVAPDDFQVFKGSQFDTKSAALARTSELGMYAIRYRAGGGENGLHSHPGDSIWLLIRGAATFWAQDSVVLAELKPLDGVMVPGGAKYRFLCTEDSVLYRFSGSEPAAR